MINNIQKNQEGGAVEDQQAQLMQLLQAAQQGDQNALQQLQQIYVAYAKQNNQQPSGEGFKQFIQAMTQQVQQAKHGAKLQYIKSLRGICPEGQELTYYKVGGKVCKKCMQKAKEQKDNLSPVERFKQERKMQKGGTAPKKATPAPKPVTKPVTKPVAKTPKLNTPEYKKWYTKLSTNDKVKEDLKNQNKDTKSLSEKCGGKVKKMKKHLFGGKLLNSYITENALNRLKGWK